MIKTTPLSSAPSLARYALLAKSGIPSPSRSPKGVIAEPNVSPLVIDAVNPPVVLDIFCSDETVPSSFINKMYSAPRKLPPSLS